MYTIEGRLVNANMPYPFLPAKTTSAYTVCSYELIFSFHGAGRQPCNRDKHIFDTPHASKQAVCISDDLGR